MRVCVGKYLHRRLQAPRPKILLRRAPHVGWSPILYFDFAWRPHFQGIFYDNLIGSGEGTHDILLVLVRVLGWSFIWA